MKVITMGAHILDVLVRPVDAIPDGQQTALVEDIRVTAAGTAAGTALTLAKLGATVRTAGAIGADATGELLLTLLGRAGIDTTLVVRKPELPTSMSVLPIRGNGERPSLHLLGANPGYTLDDVDWNAVAETDHLHLGGPELIGAESAARILLHAKAHGATTSIDLIAPGALGTLDAIAAALPHCDYLLPNAEQVIGFTGAVDLTEGAHILLDAGVGMIAATDGADGAVLFDGSTSRLIPAHDVRVIDTTGCGDAFSAGFLYAMGVCRSPLAAAQLGTAVAALVAQGLGSDHGDFTLDTADAFAAATPTRPSGS